MPGLKSIGKPMPQPSAFDSLSPEQRAAIETQIVKNNFANLDGLVAWLGEQGLEISRSAVGRLNQKLKKRLQQVKDATDACKLIVEASPDDANSRNAAVISLVQTEMFNTMLALQEISEDTKPAERVHLLKEASHSILNISKSAIAQKNWEAEFRKKVREEAAEELTQELKNDGISEEVEASIRRILIGR